MGINKNYTDEIYVKEIIRFNYNYYASLPVSKPLLNNPPKDTFEKRGNSVPSFKQNEKKWLTKENMIIGGAGLALTATAATIGIIKGKGFNKIIKGLQGTVSDNQRVINELQNAANDNKKVIDELRTKISKLSELPADLKKAKDVLIEKYKKLISNAALSYDALTPPLQKTDSENYVIKYAKRIFNFTDITPFTRKSASASSDIIDTSSLKKALSTNGNVEISLPITPRVKPVLSSNAKIEGLSLPDLGKTVNTDFKIAYGARVNWSEEKIARDIMQNFYDGHGNTLDGVRVAVRKLPDGQYKIKILGNATFDYENLQFMGSGSKLENPYNAGGFGEGAKVLVTNMLGKGDTSSVKYSCADWELTFDSAKGIMRRTLNKADTPIEGNSVEFATGNKKLVDSILDSVNYFEHSKNPDFQGLHFDSRDFGFRFLEGADAKGNVYLTQRFEFGQTGKWNNGVDDLDIIFKRKPDPQRFREIIGKELSKDRDRQFLTFGDIKDYTRYFAYDMSDEDLVKAFMTTKPKWSTIPKNAEKSALGSFVEGLIEEMERRRIAIDFGQEKLAAKDYLTNEVVINTLNGYGYKILPDYFQNTGLNSASVVFDKFSIHKALTPTEDEIKKLKLLEKGVEIIKGDIDIAFTKHRQNAFFKFGKGIKPSTISIFISRINEDADINKIINKYMIEKRCCSIYDFDKETFDKILKEMEPVIAKKLKNGTASDDLLKNLYELSTEKGFDRLTGEYLSTYKSFNLIKEEDVIKPRLIFDRTKEIAGDTLGEAITDKGDYFGHWVDREYLKKADFSNLLATWLHEISHKAGGDGTSEFTYALTDLIQALVSPGASKDTKIKLAALEEVFNSIGKTAV